jgi:hypothetical protein
MMITMMTEILVESMIGKEPEVLGGSLPRCHSVHNRSDTYVAPASNVDRRGGKPATNRLSYDKD